MEARASALTIEQAAANNARRRPRFPGRCVIAKEANAGLDALETTTLERDLPGVVAAFDRGAMRDRLQDCLFDSRHPARVERCNLTSAILLDDCVAVRYELGLESAGTETDSVMVTCRVYPDAATASAYAADRLAALVGEVRGRDEVSRFAEPVRVMESLAMVVYAYPLDGELPTLVAATDTDVARRTIEDMLARHGDSRERRSRATIVGCRVEPVHYNRRHRCMLRYHLDFEDGSTQVLYGKVAGDGSGAGIPPIVAALGPTLEKAGVAVPECLGFSDELQLTLFTEIPGSPRVTQLLKARLAGEPEREDLTVETAVDMCARIAAALHTSDLSLGRPRPLHAELDKLRAFLPRMARLSPELGERLDRCLDAVEKRAASTPELDHRQCHGDFSYTQLIFDGPRGGLVDFDNFCTAEPALDLGQFLAYVRRAGFKTSTTSAAERSGLTERLAQRFSSSYVAAGGAPEALERVDVYEPVNLVRMAEHAWQNLKGRRLEHIVTVLGERLSL